MIAKSQPITYLKCPKGDFHDGEMLNMVCLEKACSENLGCCCACLDPEHNKHVTKPLKMVITEARSYASTIKCTEFNIDVMLDIINSSKANTFQLFFRYKEQIMDNLNTIEQSLLSYYNSTIEQIVLKNTDSKAVVQQAIGMICDPANLNELKVGLKKVVAILHSKEEGEQVGLTETDLIYSLKISNSEVDSMIGKNIEEVNSRLMGYNNSLKELVNNMNIWKKANLKFSPIYKHPDVKVVTDHLVKASNNSGYKFAVMEPSIEKGDIRSFAFRIKESSSNWVAVGLCHRNVVSSKNYGFNFGSLGHGAYMISSNGGSWSHVRGDQNNSVKCFKFAKGDIIVVKVRMSEKKVTFHKKSETYELALETKVQDGQVYPCVLFYYVNDEVEYLPNHKE